MPDAGDFGRRDPGRAPSDWASAIAALPPCVPDADGWQRVRARLPSVPNPPRARWPWALAAAASLALAVAIPMHLQPEPGDAAMDGAVTAPVPTSLAVAPANRDRSAQLVEKPTAHATAPAAAVSIEMPSRADTARKPPVRRPAVAPSRRPIRTMAQPEKTLVAARGGAAELEPLYAQSAQLESLLEMARDNRVASGPVAALADELDAQVAGIDAALIQPGLPDQRRSELWGERVDTLRQLVGVEATQRLLAAHGQQYHAALVSID